MIFQYPVLYEMEGKVHRRFDHDEVDSFLLDTDSIAVVHFPNIPLLHISLQRNNNIGKKSEGWKWLCLCGDPPNYCVMT